jgi:dolichyl-phosphate-mannose--protein O-mannosyl transferase
MLNYHSGLTVTHPFSSRWWTWPIILKPLWLYYRVLPDGRISTITAMGNPVIWWMGISIILDPIENLIRNRSSFRWDDRFLFLTILFFSQWIPYLFITRPTFIYHFYINVPILCLSNSYILVNRDKSTIYDLFILGITCVFFIVFYPVISGFPVVAGWIEKLKWLRSWQF